VILHRRYDVGCRCQETALPDVSGARSHSLNTHPSRYLPSSLVTSPESYTRDGVTYPSELAGIAGYVSTLTSDLLNISTSGVLKKATPESILTTCVPRTIVTVTCKDNLDDTGMSWNDLGKSDTNGFMDTQQSQFCGRDGAECQNRQRPDYGSGTISLVSAFGRLKTTGHSSLTSFISGRIVYR